MSVYGSKIQGIKKIENITEYFSHSKNGVTKYLSTQIFFQRFRILRDSKTKEIVVHSKPFVKMIGVLLLMCLGFSRPLGLKLLALSPHSCALGPHFFKKIKFDKSFKSLWSQCYQHLHHGYCHHYHYHYHIQQVFTSPKLTTETLKQGVNLFNINNKDTRTTSLTTGTCPLQL